MKGINDSVFTDVLAENKAGIRARSHSILTLKRTPTVIVGVLFLVAPTGIEPISKV